MKVKSGEDSPRYRALLQLLRTADTVWDASRLFFQRWDLGPSQFNVLNLLHLNPEGLSQSDLSRLLIMHRSNVTGLVDRLEQRGLVTRKDVAGDRRAYRVRLTPAATKLLQEILPDYFQGAERVCGHLSDTRASRFLEELTRLAQNAQRLTAEFEK